VNLYKLDPIGIGTEHVESFPSYVTRLATVHGMSIENFFSTLREYDRRHNWRIKRIRESSPNPWKTLAMVRPTKNTRDIVGIIERHTGRSDLRCTTFLAMEHLKSRSVDLFSDQVRWCPCCLLDDIENGRTTYFRLIWCFEEVEYCHHHNVKLEDGCPSCNRYQIGVRRSYDLSACRHCDESLCSRVRPMTSATLFREICFKDLISLVIEVGSDPNLVYDPMDSIRLLEEIFGVIWSLYAESNFWQSIPKGESFLEGFESKPIPVRHLRRIAYRLGISFPGLLAGEADCWTPQLNPAWLADLPENLRPKKRRQLVNREEVLRSLNDLRASVDPMKPPSLALVARIVGISTGGLEYLHPMVCEEIKRDYQQWLQSERKRKHREALVEVWAYLKSDTVGKSRKNALKTIRARTNLPKNVLLKVIAKEFEKTRGKAQVRSG